MTVSRKTADGILEVVVRHIPRERVDAFLAEMSRVEGNTSFQQTVQLVHNRWSCLNVEEATALLMEGRL